MMLRWVSAFLLAAGIWCCAQAQVPMTGAGPAGSLASYDPATTAWVNAVVTAGGTVSTTQKGYVNTLIVGLKTTYTTNYFTSCDRIWPHASENTQQASIDIINLATLTPHNSPTFTANVGYTGNATTMYFDTGFQTGTNFVQNSASISTYVPTTRAGTSTYTEVGAWNSGASIRSGINLWTSNTEGLLGFPLNGADNSFASGLTNVRGFWLNSRTSSAGGVSLYKNGSSVTTLTGGQASNTPPAFNFFILAANDATSVTQNSGDTVSETSFCGGFTATQAGQFMTLINAYMTSVGANVY